MIQADPPSPSARRLLNVARLALQVARRVLPDYSHRFSPKKFTQPQLAACVVLKVYFRQDYRGICALLELMPTVRNVLALRVTPNYSTLARFAQRVLDEETLARMLAEVMRAVSPAKKKSGSGGRGGKGRAKQTVDIAIDSTGMADSTASSYFITRSGRHRRRWVKLSLAVTLRQHLILAAVADFGPNNDKIQFAPVLKQMLQTSRISGQRIGRLLADKGYDAEWIHRSCRERHGIESWIDPVVHRKDGLVGGRWRRHCFTHRPADFGQRWQVESTISGLKRRMGNTIAARGAQMQRREIVLKALAWSIHR